MKEVELFSLLLDQENTFSMWAVSRGQIPVCSRDPSPWPTRGSRLASQTFSPHILDVPVVSRKDSSRTCVRSDV